QVMNGLRISPLDVRSEVERRLARWRAEGADKKEVPYLLMLVRPDGINSYYRTLTALEGLEIDFGYEFIDADWILDFPDDDHTPATQPWMTKANPAATGPATANAARRPTGRDNGNPGVGPLQSGLRGGAPSNPGVPVALLAPVPGQPAGSAVPG